MRCADLRQPSVTAGGANIVVGLPAVAVAAPRSERRGDRRLRTPRARRLGAHATRRVDLDARHRRRRHARRRARRLRRCLTRHRHAADRPRGLRVPRRSRSHRLHRRHREPAGRGRQRGRGLARGTTRCGRVVRDHPTVDSRPRRVPRAVGRGSAAGVRAHEARQRRARRRRQARQPRTSPGS